MIETKNLEYKYDSDDGDSINVLKGVNLNIKKGEFVLICGKSGCGKSTLLRHLKTVLTPHGERSGCC